MLGVRREGVTEAAGKLQRRKLIRYARGRITVLDRPKLEKSVCECYAVVKKEYDRLLVLSPCATVCAYSRPVDVSLIAVGSRHQGSLGLTVFRSSCRQSTSVTDAWSTRSSYPQCGEGRS